MQRIVRSETFGEVLKRNEVTLRYEHFFQSVEPITAPENLKELLLFAQQHIPFDSSVEAMRENMVYPILREVWKQFIGVYTFWVGVQLSSYVGDEDADYVFAACSPFGKVVFDTPRVAVVQVKFAAEPHVWGKCLQNMIELKEANDQPLPVFGIVTDGQTWEFGKLENHTLTIHPDLFDRNKLDELFSALTYVLETCKRIYNL